MDTSDIRRELINWLKQDNLSFGEVSVIIIFFFLYALSHGHFSFRIL